GNNEDILGNTRATTRPSGVPDIGAYEFTPTSVPPAASANNAPSAGGSTVYTLGQDTVAVIDWAASATVPASVSVHQYTGTQPPSFIAGSKPYIYTDIISSSLADHDVHLYYKDPWVGTLA